MNAVLPYAHGNASMQPRGYTLVETVIIVAVLAIAALLVIPVVSEDGQVRLRQAAELLAADIDHARIESMGAAADPCIIVFDSAANAYFLARSSKPTTPMANTTTGVDFYVHYGSGRASALTGVTLGDLSLGGDNVLAFDGQGALGEVSDVSISLKCLDKDIWLHIDAVSGDVTIE